MVDLFGKKYSKEQLLKKVGDISQIAGVRLEELNDGYERGSRIAKLYTGSGLEFTVSIDRSLDISMSSFRGLPLSWRSAMTDRHPSYYDDKALGWLRSFPGGLLTTCGLTHVGSPCIDNDVLLGLHGRISNTPATNVYADGDWNESGSYEIWIQGKMRDTVVFGDNLELQRRISTELGSKTIKIYDKVVNLGYHTTEHMQLYHINAGFPVVDTDSILYAPIRDCQPRDEDAACDKELHDRLSDPIHGFKEKVYYLDLGVDSDDRTAVALINPSINNGFGFAVKFSKKELPKFVQWKNTDERDYVVGLEPSNCWVSGRDQERERGTLQFIEPGEVKEFNIEIDVISGSDEVENFKKYIKTLK